MLFAEACRNAISGDANELHNSRTQQQAGYRYGYGTDHQQSFGRTEAGLCRGHCGPGRPIKLLHNGLLHCLWLRRRSRFRFSFRLWSGHWRWLGRGCRIRFGLWLRQLNSAVAGRTLDRLAEAALLLSILVLYAREQSVVLTLLVGITLFGSLLVSYIRARAEALGLECPVGFFTRAERVIVLALGLLLSQINYALVVALAVIAVFSLITAGQRLLYVRQQIKISNL